MKINLYLIRHASSEINENKMSVTVDPNITKSGKKQCEELKKFLEKKFKTFQNCKIYASILCRTQETALMSIPRKTVVVSNYLKEHEYILQYLNIRKYSNFPLKNVDEQQEKIKKVVGSISTNRLKYEDDIINHKRDYKSTVFHQEGDIDMFLKKNKIKFKEDDTVIIFCHGKLIRHFLKRKEKKKNCTVIKIINNGRNFDFEKKDEKPVFEVLFSPLV